MTATIVAVCHKNDWQVESEIDSLIADALSESGAASIKDLGEVMGILKPKLAGRADMGAVSAKIKSALS